MTREARLALLGLFGLGLGALALMHEKTPPKPKGPYIVTPEDHLWLLRAVEAEGPPQISVAKTLVNLFMYLRGQGDTHFSTLTSLIRAYASPVNPRWYIHGDKFLGQLALTKPEDRPKAIAQARKRETVHSMRTDFSPATIEAVDKALSEGMTGDWTDYGAPTVDASKKYERRTESVEGLNTFWSRAPGWAGYAVQDGRLVGLG